MRKKGSSTTALAPEQRTLVLGVAVAQLMILSISASLNYMLPAMVAEFGASEEESQLLRQVSSLAALLVVFLAGVMGERLGDRRVMVGSALLFVVGSVLVAIAPSMHVATLGLLLANVGKAVISVLALAMLAARISDPDGRATAFATVSSLVPIAYLIMPIVAGALVSGIGWRWVAVAWSICGLVALWAIRFQLPRDGVRTGGSGEMWTPALAGLALAVGVQFVGDFHDEGWTTATITYVVVFVLCMIALVVLYRRLSNPSLSLAPLRHGGLMLLFLVLILFSFANLYYYSTLLYQIVYGYSALGAAIVMIPAQLCSIAGAVVARKLLQRKGISFTGTSMITAMGCILTLGVLMQADFPLVVPVILVSAYAVVSVAAYVAMTNAIMNLAEKGREGETSSYRSAASNVGSALGVAVMTSVVSLAGLTSMNNQLAEAGMSASEVSDAAWALLDGSSPQSVSDQYGISTAEASQISDMEKVAFVQSYRAQAVLGGVISIAAGGLFFVRRRRQERTGVAG